MAGKYSIGSQEPWAGLSKLLEEAGEVIQVGGKIMGTGGVEEHWDGTNLRARMEEELGDLHAAMWFFAEVNGIDFLKIKARAEMKLQLFNHWHKIGDPL